MKIIKKNKTQIDNQVITNILTVNGVRFSFEDGSWGLIRASSNKPSLVVVTESPTSDDRKKKSLLRLGYKNIKLDSRGKIISFEESKKQWKVIRPF